MLQAGLLVPERQLRSCLIGFSAPPLIQRHATMICRLHCFATSLQFLKMIHQLKKVSRNFYIPLSQKLTSPPRDHTGSMRLSQLLHLLKYYQDNQGADSACTLWEYEAVIGHDRINRTPDKTCNKDDNQERIQTCIDALLSIQVGNVRLAIILSSLIK